MGFVIDYTDMCDYWIVVRFKFDGEQGRAVELTLSYIDIKVESGTEFDKSSIAGHNRLTGAIFMDTGQWILLKCCELLRFPIKVWLCC